MSQFDELIPKIPLNEAAAFFYKVKHAGWADPPDLTGELEGQFNVPAPQVAGFLAQVITAKFKMVVAYYTYGESMRDLAQHPIGEIFREHAGHELEAAEYYLKRASVLGGAVSLQDIEPPPASTDPVHIIQVMMRAEQEAIALQRQLKDMVGEANPMKVEVEEKLAQDQHHLDELWQMLPSEMHEAAQGAMAAAAPSPDAEPAAPAESSGPEKEAPQGGGTKSESGNAARPESKEAALRMRLGLQMKLAAMKLGFGAPLDEYMAAEQAGQEAQHANEAEFYRGRLQEAQQSGMATQQQIADLQQQLAAAQEQQAQVGATIQAANEEAMAARDDAMQHAQMAANMRLGYQKIREQILQLASQDPEMMNSLPTAMPPGAGAGMAPGMADGMGVGQPAAAAQATLPGEVPAEDGGPGAPGAVANGNGQSGASSANPTAGASSVKMGGAMDHAGAIAGGAIGAVAGAKNALGKAKELPERAAALESASQANDGSFEAALNVAKARAGVAQSEAASQHPLRTAIAGGLAGGAMGATGGAMAQRLGGNLKQLFQ